MTAGIVCRLREAAFFLLMVLFVLQDKLQQMWKPFQYFDEGFAVLFVPLLLWYLLRRQRPFSQNLANAALVILLGIFLLCGFAGHFVYQYQPFVNAAKDALVNVKFFLAAGTSYLLFLAPAFDFAALKRRLWPFLYAVTVVLFVLCLLDAAFHIFSNDTRGGLPAVKLFYNAQTTLVSCCVFLGSMFFWFYEKKKKKIIPPLAMLSAVMFSTLRVKAVGAIACFVVVYLFVLRPYPKLGKKMTLLAGVVLAFAGAAGIFQIVRYYVLMGVESARAVLTIAAPFAAWDHFPTGCGFATFGSAFSAEPYSPVYGMYRMAGVWGLSPGYHDFISDTYWPMVLAQTGFFGFAALIGALVLFCRRLLVLRRFRPMLASAAVPMLYLFISSTSESAFANPISVPFAFWIGFLLARYYSGMELRRQLGADDQ